MNWPAVRGIIRKDLLVVSQSKAVVIPMIVVPLVIVVLMPLLIGVLARLAGDELAQEVPVMFAGAPPVIADQLAGYTAEQAAVYLFLVYTFAPLYLILPLMVSNVIAADSFAGEKERKTLEALVYTPTTDRELLLAKLLAAWIPGILVAWLSFIAYAVVANAAVWSVMQEIFFPTPMWWILVLWVAPAAAGLGLMASVLVSARVTTFQEAYQLGSVVVLPVVALMVAQMAGLLYFDLRVVFFLGLFLWLLDGALLWYGARTFSRSELVARL